MSISRVNVADHSVMFGTRLPAMVFVDRHDGIIREVENAAVTGAAGTDRE
jgi:hypothetical protein